jgi:predicted DNA-binding protein YlxM (UPF0122 family)
MDQPFHLALLLELYGQLLTSKQWEIANAYYRYNLSLKEISEEKNITRSAVNFSLKETKKKLLLLEDKLHMLAKQTTLQKAIEASSLKEKEKQNLLSLL